MNATKMKAHLQAFSRTLDNKEKDEWWGTMREVWQDLYPKFLMWYNSHHNRIEAKEHKKNKTLNLTISVEEADTLILLLDRSIGGVKNRQEQEDRRALIARMQMTPAYLRHAGVI